MLHLAFSLNASIPNQEDERLGDLFVTNPNELVKNTVTFLITVRKFAFMEFQQNDPYTLFYHVFIHSLSCLSVRAKFCN